MINPEEKALQMFNSSLKQLISKDVEMTKIEAKEICYDQLLKIKEALENVCILDNVPVSYIKNTKQYYLDVQKNIDRL